jgi:hypothetical protein
MRPWGRCPRLPGRDLLTVELEQALRQEGCAICRLVLEGQERSLWILLWENVNDPGVRSDLRAGLGFCAEHTAALCHIATHRIGSIVGVVILFADILAEAARRLEARPPLEIKRRCIQCRRDAEVARAYGDRLARYVPDPQWASRWLEHVQLCLPHGGLLPVSMATRTPYDGVDGIARSAVEHACTTATRFIVAAQDLLFGRRPLGDLPRAPRLECSLCIAEAYEERALAAALATSGRPWPPCREHAAVVAQQVGHTALVALYTDALARARQAPDLVTSGGRRWLRRPVRPAGSPLPACPICVGIERWRPRAATRWWQRRTAEAGADPGALFCLSHLELLRAAAPDAKARAALAREQALRLRSLVVELGELLRKLDWNNRHEPRGAEQTSWVRAAHWLASEVGAVRDLVGGGAGC